MTTGNRIHINTAGFEPYQGALFARDNGEILQWYWYVEAVGEENYERGPYSSEAKASASIRRKVASLKRRDWLLGK